MHSHTHCRYCRLHTMFSNQLGCFNPANQKVCMAKVHSWKILILSHTVIRPIVNYTKAGCCPCHFTRHVHGMFGPKNLSGMGHGLKSCFPRPNKKETRKNREDCTCPKIMAKQKSWPNRQGAISRWNACPWESHQHRTCAYAGLE